MNYRNISNPQNTTLPTFIQEFLGARTFAEAFEMTAESQLLIEDIENEVYSFPFDNSHGKARLKRVSKEKQEARTEFIQSLHVMGLSIRTINRLTNLKDKQMGWGEVGKKTIQRALPKRGLN